MPGVEREDEVSACDGRAVRRIHVPERRLPVRRPRGAADDEQADRHAEDSDPHVQH